MTFQQGCPRRLRYTILLAGFLLVAMTLPAILSVRASLHYRERARYAKQQVEGLKSRRPENVPALKWDRGVDWTSNAISQIYFSPEYGDIKSLENLCLFLDRQMQTDPGLNTLRSIWEEYEHANGSGQRYAKTFRDVRLLTDEPITDNDLATLWSLDCCLSLDLSNTAVTDTGMEHLAGARFQLLDLSGTKVGDRGIKALTQIKSLHCLLLGDTQITDDGLKELLDQTAMRSLSLTHTFVTDDGLKYVGQLTGLETLWLGATEITDDGLAHLKNLHHMTQLDLSMTSVTSQGISQLKGLKSLRVLLLHNSAISKVAIAHLQLDFPDCRISHN